MSDLALRAYRSGDGKRAGLAQRARAKRWRQSRGEGMVRAGHDRVDPGGAMPDLGGSYRFEQLNCWVAAQDFMVALIVLPVTRKTAVGIRRSTSLPPS